MVIWQPLCNLQLLHLVHPVHHLVHHVHPVLTFTTYIEKDFQLKNKTSVVFLDLTAVYDIV